MILFQLILIQNYICYGASNELKRHLFKLIWPLVNSDLIFLLNYHPSKISLGHIQWKMFSFSHDTVTFVKTTKFIFRVKNFSHAF